MKGGTDVERTTPPSRPLRPLVAKRAPLYLPNGFKDRTNTITEGQAESGEISPKGLVSHTEDWEGRISARVQPATVRVRWDPTIRKWRLKTMQELIDEGLFIVGKGPRGIRSRNRHIEH